MPDRDLALPLQPRKVVHSDFGDRETGHASFGEKLGVDEEIARFQAERLDLAAPEDLQGAIAIAHAGPEQRPYDQIVSTGIELARPMISAVDPEAADDVVLLCRREEPRELPKI